MSQERERIDELSEAISDSQEIDWDAEQRAAKDPEDARVIRQLALVAHLADANRRLSSNSRDLPFPTWGHLRLLTLVGAGSYGDVFRAWDETLEQEVALKLYHPSAQLDPIKRNVLLEEARNLAKVRHENVVRVLGADIHRGRIGFWMEFLVGETLESILASQGKLDTREASAIGIKVCRGLSAVHAAGVIHRDIKPANVFREADGRVCLLDFGAGTAEPHSSQRIGTPVYMAPETLLHARSSKHSDIYSLGVLLFHMVSNRFPVESADRQELQRKHESRERLSLADLQPDLPTAFQRIVKKCLEPDPANRYADVGEVASALSEVCAPRTPRRARQVAALSILVSLAFVSIPLGSIYVVRRAQHTESRPTAPTIAVASFRSLAGLPDSTSATALADLVNTGLLEVTPWRVLTPEHLRELKRRRSASERGAFTDDEASAVARDGDATLSFPGRWEVGNIPTSSAGGW